MQGAEGNTVGGSLQQNTVGRDQHNINIHIANTADEQRLLEQARRVWGAQHHLTHSDEHLPGPLGTSPQPGLAPHPKPIYIGAEADKAPITSRGLSRRTLLLGGSATLAATATALVAVRLTGTDGKKVQGPKPLSDWNAFRDEGFTKRIDAVMQTPDNINEYWVFSGSWFIRIHVANGESRVATVTQKSMPLSDWGSLRKSSPPVTKIDAVMQTPDNINQYWVFSEASVLLLNVKDGKNHIDEVLLGPRPLSEWSSLRDSRTPFKRIDAVAQTPDNINEYWVFSGSRFIRIRVEDGTGHPDTAVQEPRPLSEWGGLGGYPNFAARVDAVMRMPDDWNEYVVFSGQEYIRTSWSGSAWSVK